jgi:uncharacterized protein
VTDQPVAEDDDDLEDGEFDDELDDDADDDLDEDDELDDDGGDDDEEEDDDGDDDDEDDDDDGPDGNRRAGALPIAMLEYVAKSLVDDPESVVIDVEEGRRALTLRLHVDPSDMGRVIGRRGRVAQAIRTVVRAAGAREGTETVVDIVD